MRYRFSARLLLFFLSLIILLNTFDGVASAYWVAIGWAYEANPFMKSWMDIGYGAFLYFKLSMAPICSVILWKLRDRSLVHILTPPVIGVYAYILFKHLTIAYNVFYSM